MFCVKGDAVEHRFVVEFLAGREKAGAIDPTQDLSIGRRDACDSIGVPDIGIDFAVNKL